MAEEPQQQKETGIGGFVFVLTCIAMLQFFWWLLIFDHGVAATH